MAWQIRYSNGRIDNLPTLREAFTIWKGSLDTSNRVLKISSPDNEVRAKKSKCVEMVRFLPKQKKDKWYQETEELLNKIGSETYRSLDESSWVFIESSILPKNFAELCRKGISLSSLSEGELESFSIYNVYTLDEFEKIILAFDA